MALTTDQTAILRLLIERRQGYAELATLLGVEQAEVRARARAALSALGGWDPDREVGLTDYLLGQADPIGRADAVRHLRESADDHRSAAELVDRLREMFPGAELPRLPGEPRAGRFLRRAPGPPSTAPPGPPRAWSVGALSPRQTRTLVAAGSAAILLVVAVLAVTGAFGGGDDDTAPVTETATLGGDDETIERVSLEARGGGNAEGEAVFGLATGDQPFVDVSLRGLEPAPRGRTYVVWLMLSKRLGYPISPIAVGDQGNFQDRFAIPAVALPLVARVQFVDISIADDDQLARLILDAQRRAARPDANIGDLVLEQPGDSVLRGVVPRAGDGGD